MRRPVSGSGRLAPLDGGRSRRSGVMRLCSSEQPAHISLIRRRSPLHRQPRAGVLGISSMPTREILGRQHRPRDRGCRHKPLDGWSFHISYPPGTFWLVFPEQWTDARSPWSDKRVRLAVNYAIDRSAINQAETLGLSKITGSMIPQTFESYWQPPRPVYDLVKARQLLADAGYPNGFDAGDYYCDASYANLGEAVVNYLRAAGIRAHLRPL